MKEHVLIDAFGRIIKESNRVEDLLTERDVLNNRYPNSLHSVISPAPFIKNGSTPSSTLPNKMERIVNVGSSTAHGTSSKQLHLEKKDKFALAAVRLPRIEGEYTVKTCIQTKPYEPSVTEQAMFYMPPGEAPFWVLKSGDMTRMVVEWADTTNENILTLTMFSGIIDSVLPCTCGNNENCLRHTYGTQILEKALDSANQIKIRYHEIQQNNYHGSWESYLDAIVKNKKSK